MSGLVDQALEALFLSYLAVQRLTMPAMVAGPTPRTLKITAVREGAVCRTVRDDGLSLGWTDSGERLGAAASAALMLTARALGGGAAASLPAAAVAGRRPLRTVRGG